MSTFLALPLSQLRVTTVYPNGWSGGKSCSPFDDPGGPITIPDKRHNIPCTLPQARFASVALPPTTGHGGIQTLRAPAVSLQPIYRLVVLEKEHAHPTKCRNGRSSSWWQGGIFGQRRRTTRSQRKCEGYRTCYRWDVSRYFCSSWRP